MSAVRALLVGALFLAIYYMYQMISGIILTKTYAPDIVQRYEQVDYLQHKVSFGVVVNGGFPMMELGIVILGMAVYCVARLLKNRKPNER